MPSRSISLRAQLVVTLAGAIVATAAVLATEAYRAASVDLERNAWRAVRVAAHSRAETVTRVIDGQIARTEHFLTAAEGLCGEKAGALFGWEIECASRALEDFRAAERAVGAALIRRSQVVASAGRPIAWPAAIPLSLALIPSAAGDRSYLIRADDGLSEVRLEFSLSDLDLLFDQPLGLGSAGEVFLRDSAGVILTPPRFAPATVGFDTGSSESPHPCAAEPAAWVGTDYRGVASFHSLAPVPVFVPPVCVDAHLEYAAALAPADTLLQDLALRGGVFALFGIAVALAAASGLVSPLRRLAAAARALEAGEFDRRIPITGSSEVRNLARSFAAMARAIGEQMRREQHAREEAERANRAKDEFLAMLSHELRTPLTATLGWTRLLRLGHLDPARVDRAIAAIERSAQTQSRLIEDLLDVSRFIAGRLQIERSPVWLADPVRAALDDVGPMAADKRVALHSAIEASPVVMGDAVRLQQITANLLVNAVKFTAPGGSITLKLATAEGSAVLTVADTGIGIAPEFLPHVFDRFRQAEGGPTRKHGGLGLGLAIVQHLVKLHGGSVEALSEGPGTGATFVVRLPLAAAVAATRPREKDERRHTSVSERAGRLEGVRLLLVDDDEDTRRVVAALMEEAGAVVDEASSAEEGRRQLGSQEYSAIVCDLAMPQEDGYAFMRGVRQAGRSIPAIALTALTRRQDRIEAEAAGFQAFLNKPVDRDRLIATIAELVQSGTA